MNLNYLNSDTAFIYKNLNPKIIKENSNQNIPNNGQHLKTWNCLNETRALVNNKWSNPFLSPALSQWRGQTANQALRE